MIGLDAVRLITPAYCLTNLNKDSFSITYEKGGKSYYKYQQKIPFALTIIHNESRNRLTLDFTAKILLDNYPSLITTHTIRECLENINCMGICQLNIDSIMDTAIVEACDVTKDVCIPIHDIKELDKHLATRVKNNKKYTYKVDNNGISVVHNADRKKKTRLKIYDKAHEITLSKNNPFLTKIKDKEKVLDYFMDKYRVEVSIGTRATIREYFGLGKKAKTLLTVVLNSCENPILTLYDKFFYDTITVAKGKKKMAERCALLQKCNYNLQEVEASLREHMNPNDSISRLMRPYRELLAKQELDGLEILNIHDILEGAK